MDATKPEGENGRAQRKEARNVVPQSPSNMARKRFVLVATVLATGADGDVEVRSRSVVVDEWSESDHDAKHQFEEWMDAQLDPGGEGAEDGDTERFRDDDPWEEGGF